ncbi:hypothetical protein [Flavobacterium columnare]|uniref:Uncharacterized protein n=1 Tax=Flavobacterium columnare TaxID=996 RepID=A0AAI8GB80_9FLAO|nr:hypothetical protein [Flavobacterium columnare]AMO20682.1 hypothetical protein UN65_10350 [Flavobacterium columnare]AUX18659.1 hypothetical protein AQ623_10510 [Flavobacterium columnare]QOG57740.1 hypothetical protein HUE29_10415 [Flavobacterium columnare]QOG60464.1 hypothetical protein HUE30_10415 [Flavobacterium columnare]QOG63184.1 hypothetical protein HUE31_10415 [Flavobacterium columnare]
MKGFFVNIETLFVVVLFFMSINTYSQLNQVFYDLNKSNAYIENSSIREFIKIKKLKNDKEKMLFLNVNFKNNPFQIDDSYQVMLLLNREIIYNGAFVYNGFKAMIPVRLINKKLSPRVVIYKKDKFYTFSSSQSLKTIKNTDNLIHIIFMPDNEAESIYFVSTDWRINEN